MDILLTEEEKMLQNTAREFLEAECPTRLVRDMEVDEKGYPPDLWKQVADLGSRSVTCRRRAVPFAALAQ